jgi:hypothetical protein
MGSLKEALATICPLLASDTARRLRSGVWMTGTKYRTAAAKSTVKASAQKATYAPSSVIPSVIQLVSVDDPVKNSFHAAMLAHHYVVNHANARSRHVQGHRSGRAQKLVRQSSSPRPRRGRQRALPPAGLPLPVAVSLLTRIAHLKPSFKVGTAVTCP